MEMKGRVNIRFFSTSNKPELHFFIGSKRVFVYYEGNQFFYQYGKLGWENII